MRNEGPEWPQFLYTYACHEDERELCSMEQRALFGDIGPNDGNVVISPRDVEASRSPFVKQRIAALYTGRDPEEIARQAERLELGGATFKIVCLATGRADDYDERRRIERLVGSRVRGRAEMRRPERLFGIAYAGGRWLFGPCAANEALWLRHSRKPRSYSTALGTRLARALVNIAAPRPAGMRLIDPCCGMGTVLVEALSMGIDIVGCDINPLAVSGARENLAYFNLPPDVVSIADMRRVTGDYGAAIVDLPYNLCSVITVAERLAMLRSVRSFARRAVVVATETIDADIEAAGFAIRDRCVVSKGSFARQIVVAE